jgi:hypothetical protein
LKNTRERPSALYRYKLQKSNPPLVTISECRIARKVSKQNLTGNFVFVTDETQPQEKTPKSILIGEMYQKIQN